jgi:hypothetical protein
LASGSAKAWRDIWGAGQGVGLMDDVPTVAEMVERLTQQYQAARERLGLKASALSTSPLRRQGPNFARAAARGLDSRLRGDDDG